MLNNKSRIKSYEFLMNYDTKMYSHTGSLSIDRRGPPPLMDSWRLCGVVALVVCVRVLNLPRLY